MLLVARGVSKSFGAVEGLVDVDFEIDSGEVVTLVGDNGAGKSTLIKAIAGVQPADRGTVRFDGREVSIRSPQDATRLGIATVYQDLALCDNLDVVANPRSTAAPRAAWTSWPRSSAPANPLSRNGRREHAKEGSPEELPMTFIWFVIWLIANNVGGHEPLVADPVNAWAGTLILAVALDLSAAHAGRAAPSRSK
jgi:ABC-type Fe3+/spermidine/putrescine transport system ATPase subunit